MDKLGTWILPAAVVVIVLFGTIRRVPVFDAFLDGAKEGLRSSISILPTLVGLLMGHHAQCIRSIRLGITSAVTSDIMERVSGRSASAGLASPFFRQRKYSVGRFPFSDDIPR